MSTRYIIALICAFSIFGGVIIAHHKQIIKQGKQIKQLEAALLVHKGEIK